MAAPTRCLTDPEDLTIPSFMSFRYRLRFAKTGDVRFLGHRDLLRTMERLFVRSGLTLRQSEGFHPKPKMSFPSALAVGIEGQQEVVEIDLVEPQPTDAILARVALATCPGLEFTSCEAIEAGVPAGATLSMSYRFAIPADRRAALAEKLAALDAAESWPIQPADRDAPIDVKAQLESASLGEEDLLFTFRGTRQAAVRPRELLAVLGVEDVESQGSILVRTDLRLIEITPKDVKPAKARESNESPESDRDPPLTAPSSASESNEG